MLYLSARSEYGLNFLILLARSKKTLSLRALAEKGSLPYYFIGRIAKDFIVAGLLQAKEGKNGGYFLARAPQKIKLAEIFTALHEDFVFARCLAAKKCATKNCKVKPVWLRLKNNISKELNKITLSNLI